MLQTATSLNEKDQSVVTRLRIDHTNLIQTHLITKSNLNVCDLYIYIYIYNENRRKRNIKKSLDILKKEQSCKRVVEFLKDINLHNLILYLPHTKVTDKCGR